MAKTEVKKRKRSFIVCFLVVALVAYFLIQLFTVRHEISIVKTQIADTQAKSEEQIAENEYLQNTIDNGNMDEYVERVARDSLGYIKPGERAYFDISVNN